MAGKKAVKLSKLTFNELKDKAKEVEGFKALNRFELLQALRQNEAAAPQPAGVEAQNPRQFKPEISALKAKLAETPKAEKKARKELRRSVVRLKRATRRYL
ncbi:MAG: hypothetical protein LBP55_03785 [Candidatus Adiutrix sp.]|jgi:hypothetical protein|nr:hypothetical protein [Candidatus Adiutrix sp.]